MSLVYEALQKAAREKNRFAVQPAESRPPAQPISAPVAAPADVVPRQSQGLWLALSLTMLAVGGAGVFMFMRLRGGLPTSATPLATIATATDPVQPAPSAVAPLPALPPSTRTAPVAEKSPAPDAGFKLTGIMRLGGEYSAVINGHVVARDQTVNGATVKSVTADQVTLSSGGREIVLQLF